MARRAGVFLVCGLVIVACLQIAGCAGTPGKFHEVVLTPSTPQIIGQGRTLPISAVVLNDSSAAGVNWALNPATGSLSGTTPMATMYNAPAMVASATPVSVKATSVTYANEFSTLQITVEPPPAITTTSLPSGTINGAYSATVVASGGVPPFTWTVSSGALPAGLSLGASTTNSVNITGTPTATGLSAPFMIHVVDADGDPATSVALTINVSDLAITTTSPLPNASDGAAYNLQFQASGGMSPYTWAVATGSTLPAGLTLSSAGLLSGTPTKQATSTFDITVTDSEGPPASLTETFSLTVTGPVGLALLKGNYAFEFSGFNSHGSVVVAGSFAADGAGNLSNGVEDFNSIQGPPANHTFTGHYTLGDDDRGQLIFTSLTGSPTYAFAIDTTGVEGRLVEFDASGTRGSGEIALQTVSTCGTSTITGDYAFELSGSAAAVSGVTLAGPAMMAGRFTATPPGGGAPGSVGLGEMDANTPGLVTNSSTVGIGVSGTYQTTSQTARCTASLQPDSLPSLTFSVYPISATRSFLVETDAVSSTEPFVLTGEIDQQVGYPFAGSSVLSAPSAGGAVGEFSGDGGNTYVPDTSIILFAPSAGNFTLSGVDNEGGAFSPFNDSSSFTIDASGRGAFVGFDFTTYVINANEVFFLSTTLDDPVIGHLIPQSAGPFNATTINGAFVEGTLSPAASAESDFSGVITLASTNSSSGTIAGTQDTSTSTANTAAQAVTGTYGSITSATGIGTFALTAPSTVTGSFIMVSPTEVVLVTTTAGDVNPVVITLGN